MREEEGFFNAQCRYQEVTERYWDIVDNTTSNNLGPKKTIVFAWGIEGVCIGIGFLVAAYVGFEATGFWAGIMAAAPFAGAAAVEFCRIPLVETFFAARGAAWKALALVMIAICAVLTAHNLLFGFDRSFNVRIEEAHEKKEKAANAQKAVQDLNANKGDTEGKRAKLLQDLETLNQREKAAKALNVGDLDKLDRERKESEAVLLRQQSDESARLTAFEPQAKERQAQCDKMPMDRCDSVEMQKRLDDERNVIKRRIHKLGEDIASLGSGTSTERKGRLADREKLLTSIRAQQAELERKLEELRQQDDAASQKLKEATDKANETAQAAEAAIRTSQMHGLSQSILGANDTATTKRMVVIFSSIIACVMSLAGSVLAAMYYRIRSQPAADRSSPLIRSMRGWLARQRRKHSIIKTVEKIVEVEKIVKVEVPVEVEKVVKVEKIVEVEVVKEVSKPELIMVPVPLDATEEIRRQIMERASKAHATREQIKSLPPTSIAAE